MQNTENTVTLFSRYKDMINRLWDSGYREYTARDLNDWVGSYEQSSWWKRANNNPYYTTRTYQSQLRELGCVTMIKRGLWKINGPIPQWFGSFHFNGLKGNLSDPSNIYWHQMPAMYKVNPWAEQKVVEKLQPPTNIISKPDLLQYTTDAVRAVAGVQVKVSCIVMVFPSSVAGFSDTDIVDTTIAMDGKLVDESFFRQYVDFTMGDGYAENLLLECVNESKFLAIEKAEQIYRAETSDTTKQPSKLLHSAVAIALMKKFEDAGARGLLKYEYVNDGNDCTMNVGISMVDVQNIINSVCFDQELWDKASKC